MSSAYGATVNVPTPTHDINSLLPINTTTSTGEHVSVVRVVRDNEDQLAQLHAMLNHEIRSGDTYPQEFEMNVEEWSKYFLSAEAFVVVKRTEKEEEGEREKGEVYGTFYIKPNFPGRCSHICNGGFIVHKNHRKKGVGNIMAQAFLKLAPALGYKASMFNLVFVSNVASVRLWESNGFEKIGRIPRAGRLRLTDEKTNTTKEEYVDAIMFYKSFFPEDNPR